MSKIGYGGKGASPHGPKFTTGYTYNCIGIL